MAMTGMQLVVVVVSGCGSVWQTSFPLLIRQTETEGHRDTQRDRKRERERERERERFLRAWLSISFTSPRRPSVCLSVAFPYHYIMHSF